MAGMRVRILLDRRAYEYFNHVGLGFGDYQ